MGGAVTIPLPVGNVLKFDTSIFLIYVTLLVGWDVMG